MSKQRVVITGIGVVSSVGQGVDAFAKSLHEGISGAGPVRAFDSTGFECVQACEVRDFAAGEWFRNSSHSDVGRSGQFAVAAASLALRDAGLASTHLSGTAVPVVVGTTDGESVPLERIGDQWHRNEGRSIEGSLMHQVPAQSIALAVSREFDLRGEALVISTACAAGNYALGMAYDMISQGESAMVLCGGSDSVCRKTFAGFHRLGTMASEHCQPFDVDRQGILVGEGSGMFLFESLDSALARGAEIYAEMLGYAVNCDADHMVAPNAESIARCMRQAHDNAGIASSDVDYVCMHGTGTRANDLTEVAAVKAVFKENVPPVSSIKSSLGHAMGAASALAAAACCLAIDREFLPPTIHLNQQDPACDVDVVPNQSRPAKPQVVQNNAFAFGGNNAITVFRKLVL